MTSQNPSPLSFTRQLPRIATGLLLAAALVACLILGGTYLAAALALISTLALYEFFQLFWPGKTRPCSKAFGLLLGLAVFCPAPLPGAIRLIVTLAFFWAALSFLFSFGRGKAEAPLSGGMVDAILRGNDPARLETHAVLPLGILYLPVILHLALALSLKEQFLVASAAIASDTAAYYAGCAYGRHKIWPRVSPQKSWEGSIAGFAAGTAVAVCIACIPYGDGPLYGGSIPLWLCIGALLCLAAQLGDFFESALKRSRGVKDSGGILPGHGGILDRIDSILFALAMYSAITFAGSCLFP